MATLDEFKQFVKTIPGVRQEVLDGHYTWQQLYEIYSLYGKNDEVFKPYLQSVKLNDTFDMQKIMFILKNLDLEAVGKSLDGVQKLLNIVIGLSSKDNQGDSFYKNGRL